MKYNKGLLYLQKKSSRAFVISLLVSLFVWMLINLSKTYVRVVHVKVSFKNLEEGTFVKNNDSILIVKLKGTGFSLISSSLNSLKYAIDTKKDKNLWSWEKKSYDFNELFPKKIEVLSVDPQEVNFDIQSLIKKKVPIQSQIIVVPKIGYGIKDYYLGQDSIVIYGDKTSIDEVSFIETDSLYFENISKSIDGVVGLKSVNEDVMIVPNKINYKYSVERFTEGSFQLDIQIKNSPKDKEISIFPKQVHIQFQSPISLFSNYRSEAFGLYVDCNEINESNILPIHIENAPIGVKNVKLLKKSVTYLLIEK